MANDEQIVLRLPAALLKRVDALAPRIAAAPAMMAFRVTRSAVLRLALERGLAELETEHGASAPKRPVR
jgi:hypothetical protein